MASEALTRRPWLRLLPRDPEPGLGESGIATRQSSHARFGNDAAVVRMLVSSLYPTLDCDLSDMCSPIVV